MIPLTLNEVPNLQARLDTGATFSFISLNLWRQIFKTTGIPGGETECVILGDGRYMFTQGVVELKVTIGKFTTPVLFRIAQTLVGDVILGQDFLRQTGCIINLAKDSLNFSTDSSSSIPFLNTTINPEVQEPVPIQNLNISPNLTVEQRLKLEQLLNKYSKVFSDKKGRTSLAMQEIHTTTEKPITCAPRKTSPATKAEISRQIDELLADGTISYSLSPWSSAVHLVDKPDGSKRFCVDYRELNKITLPDEYPIPPIESTLNELTGSKFITTLDLAQGFFQLELSPLARKKSAFICHRGKFEFNVLPMGLKNAPRNFQRLIELIFKEKEGKSLATYLDDLCVGTSDFDSHMQSLEYVLSKLQEHNLTLKKKKCFFLMQEAKILGYTLNSEGLSADEEKVKAILDYPQPKNLKQLQSFLGLAGFNQKFIPNFSTIAAPLHHLKRKNVKFVWGPDQQNSFKQIQEAMANIASLNLYDPKLPCLVTTDASGHGIGCMISQVSEGVEKPICYASRLLNPAEKNYSTIERETLAIYWAIHKYKHYLDGTKFQVKTDHRPLVWLFKQNTNSRLLRWALFLQSFDFTVIYKPGSENRVADALSRQPVNVSPEITAQSETIPKTHLNSSIDFKTTVQSPPTGILSILEIPGSPFPQITLANIKEIQLTDPDCISIKDNLTDLNSKDSSIYLMKENGILYRKPNGKLTEKIYLPVKLHKSILDTVHLSPCSGHMGQEKTLSLIKDRYYWPTMRKDVFNYVRTCDICQKYKARNKKVPGFLQSIPFTSLKPGEMIGIDLQGPFPVSKRNNRFLCVITDYATREVELFPLKSSLAKHVVNCLLQYVSRHGSPVKVVSDHGPQLISKVYVEFCKACGMTPSYSSFYHPQSNLTERMNRIIKEHIAMFLGNCHREWDSLLEFIQLAINSSKSETTGHSAFYLNKGLEPRLPWDHIDPTLPVPQTPYVQNIIADRDYVHERVTKAQARQAKYYNRRRTDETLVEGSLVLRLSHKKSNAQIGVSKKLFSKWEGPFKIVNCLSNLNYLLCHPDSNTLQGVWHISQLKPFFPKAGTTAQITTAASLDDSPIEIRNSPSVSTADIVNIEHVNPEPSGSNPVHISNNLHLPFKLGWFREVVTRKAKNSQSDKKVDIYYYSPRPQLKQFRSNTEIQRNLNSDILEPKHFSWKLHPIYHSPQEIIREAGEPGIRKLYSKV